MAELTKDIVESVFKQKVNDLIDDKNRLVVNELLQLMIDFYNEYQIQKVDSTIPDSDMLLFEYGIYDWQDGKGENFTISIVRQFYIEDEENEGFSQLHLVLYFDKDEFKGAEASSNKWSVDFENIDEWKQYVIKMPGFKLVEEKHPHSFDIFSTETD